jgi:hypothetical protein
MSILLNLLEKNYIQISRLAFQTYPEGHRYFQDLDELLSQKDNFLEFIKLNYIISIGYNSLISLFCMFYIFTRFSIIFPYDFISSTWFLLVTLIKLLELIPKFVILIQTFRIRKNSNDAVIASRRLMYLTRSNIFLFNFILGNANLMLYIFFFLFMRKSAFCEEAPQFYYIINLLVYAFLLRSIIALTNYFIYFKYGLNENEADMENRSFYKDFGKCVSKEILELIESVELNEENLYKYVGNNNENERDFCCICMLQFDVGENIKLLPCNKKHIFHGACIDKWLSNNINCPTCRKEICKKIFIKNQNQNHIH